MRRVWMIVIGAALAVVAAMPAGVTAQGRVIITLASLAPEGSVWDNELKQLAADWGKLSNNSVQLRVFSGGRLGTESSVISQMRAGARPEAAVLTTGLSELDDGFSVFSLPFFFDSLDEVSAVIEALEPVLTAKLEPQGLTLVSWGFGGWVHMFSATPITTLDDLEEGQAVHERGRQRGRELVPAQRIQPGRARRDRRRRGTRQRFDYGDARAALRRARIPVVSGNPAHARRAGGPTHRRGGRQYEGVEPDTG